MSRHEQRKVGSLRRRLWLLLFLLSWISPALVSSFSTARIPRASTILGRRNNERNIKGNTLASTNTKDDNDNVGKKSLYRRYMNQLEQRPLLTQSLTSGVISVVGDFLSQWIEARVAHTLFSVNWIRLHAFFWCGTLFVGPFVYLWFEQLWRLGRYMESKYSWKQSSWKTTLFQMMLDQTIGVAFFFPTYFYVYELAEALVGWRVPMMTLAHAKCKEQIANVLLMQYCVWPAANWTVFAFVQENLRVLATNLISVFWNAYLCTIVS